MPTMFFRGSSTPSLLIVKLPLSFSHSISSPRSRSKPVLVAAFTLLELLVVMAIMVIILAFTIPVVTGLSKSNNLNAGGRTVANLLTIARSEAINRRALIRFEVATTWPNDFTSAYRKITLVQHDIATGNDTQLTKWETLPAGISFQPKDPSPNSTGVYFFGLNPVSSVPLSGQNVPTNYIEFLPTGALNVPIAKSPVRLRVVPGLVSSVGAASVTLTSTANWMDASIDGLVGRIALARP
jgi:prepilin-type N-terminal cleavage/methylation domain-containing protein